MLGFDAALPPELAEKVALVIESELDYLPSSFKEALYYPASPTRRNRTCPAAW